MGHAEREEEVEITKWVQGYTGRPVPLLVGDRDRIAQQEEFTNKGQRMFAK